MDEDVRDLMDRMRLQVIEEGEASARRVETGGELRGALRGFEICRGCYTLADFEREIQELLHAETLLQFALYDHHITIERWWEHRYITLQVEFVYERQKALALLLGLL